MYVLHSRIWLWNKLFKAKGILIEEQLLYSLIHNCWDKRVHTFNKGISPKVKIITRLEFELAYYDVAVRHVNHYTTGTPPNSALLRPYDLDLIRIIFTTILYKWNIRCIYLLRVA